MILQKSVFYEVLCHFYENVHFCLIIEKMMKIDTRHELEEKRDFKFVFLALSRCGLEHKDNKKVFVKRFICIAL